MYNDYFGLSQAPFKITPDTSLFFPGGNRGAVLDALVYAIVNGEGIVKVVGEVGSGKTMLCRMLEQELPASVEIVYFAIPTLAPENILHAIAFELNLPVTPEDNRLLVLNRLQEYLLQRHAGNRQVVLFIEEAQSMPIATLEEIRLLSNLETQHSKLLQIVLFGQPELDEMIATREIRQLKERITYSFQLVPFKQDDTRDYLNARLRACGYRGGELFDASAVKMIDHYSRGLLRRINILADKAMLAAYAASKTRVTARHVRLAARDSEFVTNPGYFQFALPALALVLIIGLVWIYQQRDVIISMTSGMIGSVSGAYAKSSNPITESSGDRAEENSIAMTLPEPEPGQVSMEPETRSNPGDVQAISNGMPVIAAVDKDGSGHVVIYFDQGTGSPEVPAELINGTETVSTASGPQDADPEGQEAEIMPEASDTGAKETQGIVAMNRDNPDHVVIYLDPEYWSQTVAAAEKVTVFPAREIPSEVDLGVQQPVVATVGPGTDADSVKNADAAPDLVYNQLILKKNMNHHEQLLGLNQLLESQEKMDSRFTNDEFALLQQLQELPPEVVENGSVIKQERICPLCTTIIFRPLKRPEKL